MRRLESVCVESERLLAWWRRCRRAGCTWPLWHRCSFHTICTAGGPVPFTLLYASRLEDLRAYAAGLPSCPAPCLSQVPPLQNKCAPGTALGVGALKQERERERQRQPEQRARRPALPQHMACTLWFSTTQRTGACPVCAQSPVAYCAVWACLQANLLLHGVRKQCRVVIRCKYCPAACVK